METIRYQFDRDIPVVAQADVVVVGAGPGGVCAGVMAARQGADTLVVERYGCPGGMAVFGEVSPFMFSHVGERALDRPVYIDWCRQMQQYRTADCRERFPFSEERAAGPVAKDEAMLAMEDLLLDAGARLLYHHTLADVIMEDGRIVAAVFLSKSGLCAVRGRVFVDSTGDGDLAALAGCSFEFGNAEGFCQPMTTCFKLSGVDTSRMPDRDAINALFDKAKQEGRIGCPRESVLWISSLEADTIHFNTTRVVRMNAVKGADLSAAEIEGRRQVRQYIEFLRRDVPGFEQACLRSIAHHIGVRESRRIRGIAYQTREDFFTCAKYPDAIAKVAYVIDVHNPSGPGTTIHYIPQGEWYELRYGVIVPKKSRNLLMGCRAISLDHELHSSARVMPPVCSIGQAAGMAAAMCVENQTEPAALDGSEVRKRLAAAGAWL